jgi:hypothetical protein
MTLLVSSYVPAMSETLAGAAKARLLIAQTDAPEANHQKADNAVDRERGFSHWISHACASAGYLNGRFAEN